MIMIQVISAVHDSLETGLSVGAVVTAPSVAPLAPRICYSGRLTSLVAGERPEVVPLSYAQSRLWFLNQFEGGVATYNMPTAFRIRGPLDVEGRGALPGGGAGSGPDVAARWRNGGVVAGAGGGRRVGGAGRVSV